MPSQIMPITWEPSWIKALEVLLKTGETSAAILVWYLAGDFEGQIFTAEGVLTQCKAMGAKDVVMGE